MANRLFRTGHFDRFGVSSIDESEKRGTLAQLQGMIGHIDRIDRNNAQRHKQQKSLTHAGSKELASKELLYQRFLLYKEFYCAKSPTILCEGKTDNIYLKLAIKKLASTYPLLASVSSEGKAEMRIRLLKYLRNNVGRVLKLSGGTGDFPQFINSYVEALGRFHDKAGLHPIILLIDDDSGATNVYKSVKAVIKVGVDKQAPFTRIWGNLYLVVIPNKSVIEDLLDSEVKAVLLDGKTYSGAKDIDVEKYYGKHILSQMVESKASQLSFSGFGPLLDRFNSVIKSHQGSVGF